MLVQIRLGFESESARLAWVRPLVRVRPDVLLKDTRLGACQLAVRARMTTFPRLDDGFGRLRFRRNLEFVAGFFRRLLSVLVNVFPLERLSGNDVVRRGLLLGLDNLRRNFGRRHFLELFVQVLWLAIVVVVIIVVVIVVVGQLWVCHRHSVGLCKEYCTFNHLLTKELWKKSNEEEKARSHHAWRLGGGISGDSENERRRTQRKRGEVIHKDFSILSARINETIPRSKYAKRQLIDKLPIIYRIRMLRYDC